MNEEYLLLIDGSSLLSTQYYGNLPRELLFAKTPEEKEKLYPKLMMTSGGVYTNAVYGFLRTLFKILKQQKPTHLAVAWDLTRDTFRRELYADYKGNRSDTPAPLSEQFALCQEVLRRMGIPELMDPRYEADDFCGSMAALYEDTLPVRILTKDQDYLQLVTEKTHLWIMHSTAEKTQELYKKYKLDPAKQNVPERAFELDPALVEAEYGVKPVHVNSLKGLQGDSSDNIKGVKGVGPETAVKLIREYGTVDALYQAISGLDRAGTEALKKDWKERLGIVRSPLGCLLKGPEDGRSAEESARLSELLATIKRDIDLSAFPLDSLKLHISAEGVREVLRELEFSSLSYEPEEEEDAWDPRASFVTLDFEVLDAYCGRAAADPEIGLSLLPGEGLAFTCGEEVCFLPEGMFVTEDTLRNVLALLQKKGAGLFSFDGKALCRLLKDCPVRDTGIAAYLLDPLASKYPYDRVAEELLSLRLPSEESLLKARKAEPDNEALLRDLLCFRAMTALRAQPVLEKKLAEARMLSLYEELELPVMHILAEMENNGVRADRRALCDFAEELRKRAASLEQEIFSLAGEEFNINSPKQLGTVLFEHLRLPAGKKTKGSYSTAAEVLEKLAPSWPVVRRILEYRMVTKLCSTYAEGLQSYIAADGRIHGSFHQTITATGRLSSSDPNLQNIPVRLEEGRQLRKVFVPEEGSVFIDADYSQIELRVLAHMSGDANLIAAYRDAKDIHALTASQVFGVPLSEVTPEQRRNAKAVNFGIVYGISAFGLSDNLSISRAEAERYMRGYFEAYPGIEAYLKKLVEDAREKGYAETLYGRRRPVPELLSVNFNQRSFGERVAMNSPVQGTAADIMKLAMIRVDRALKEEKLRARLVLQIHDELILEAPEEEAERAEELLVREMENAAKLSVRLEVSAKRGKSWYETK